MQYTDLHCHLLYGVDDGAKTKEDMMAMLKAAYADGVRVLCATPHYHPGYYGYNGERTLEVFGELQAAAAKLYPEMMLFLGNELHYAKGADQWITEGQCRTLNGSDHLLVDFSSSESAGNIEQTLRLLLGRGYRPVLAHCERYTDLHGKMDLLEDLTDSGVFLQVNAGSYLGEFGLGCRMQARRLTERGLVYVIASDAHGVDRRPGRMDECCKLVESKYGKKAARMLFCVNGVRLLGYDLEND